MPVLILFSRKTLDLCRLSGGRGVDSKVLSILKYQMSNTGYNKREEGLTGNVRVLILNVLAWMVARYPNGDTQQEWMSPEIYSSSPHVLWFACL